MESYDYENCMGVWSLSWEEFVKFFCDFVEIVWVFELDVVVGVVKVGFLFVIVVVCVLCCELILVCISCCVDDVVVYCMLQWCVLFIVGFVGKWVVIVDEMVDIGEILWFVVEYMCENGVLKILMLVLVQYSWVDLKLDYVVFVIDEFVVFFWDVRVFVGLCWQIYLELVEVVEMFESQFGVLMVELCLLEFW